MIVSRRDFLRLSAGSGSGTAQQKASAVSMARPVWHTPGGIPVEPPEPRGAVQAHRLSRE